ncbi:Queuine tRNA-ribosyltransferase, partial [Frankliniella fusca]
MRLHLTVCPNMNSVCFLMCFFYLQMERPERVKRPPKREFGSPRQLARLVSVYPVLWDPQHPEYHVKTATEKVWIEIAKHFQNTFSPEECKHKWSVIRQTRRNFLNSQAKRNGQPAVRKDRESKGEARGQPWTSKGMAEEADEDVEGDGYSDVSNISAEEESDVDDPDEDEGGNLSFDEADDDGELLPKNMDAMEHSMLSEEILAKEKWDQFNCKYVDIKSPPFSLITPQAACT